MQVRSLSYVRYLNFLEHMEKKPGEIVRKILYVCARIENNTEEFLKIRERLQERLSKTQSSEKDRSGMEALPDILEKLENYAIHSSIDEEKGMEEYDVREQLRRQADVTLNLRGEIIREYITDYIKKNSKSRLTRNFIKKSRDYLYVEKKENEMGRLKRYDEKEHRFLGTDFIEAGWIRIKADEMGEEVREMIYTGDNSERMKLLCFWISDRKDEVKKMIGGELTKELYVRFLRILDFDKERFRTFCEEAYKSKQNVMKITREGVI